MKSLNLNIGIIALIVIVILSNAIYIVNDKQTAILLRFGEIVEPEINPGLHFKVPIYHTVKKFDSRVLTLDALPQPYFTTSSKASFTASGGLDSLIETATTSIPVL